MMLGRRGRQSGQSMILMVVVMSIAATTLSLFILQHTRNSYLFSVENKRALDIMYAMEGVARHLQYLYSYESNCDPFSFNTKINQYPRRTFTSNFRTQALNADNTQFYQVQIGDIAPFPPVVQDVGAPYGTNAGVVPAQNIYTAFANGGYFGPRDIALTYWVSPFGSAEIATGGTRYEQTIVLINNCIDPLHSPNTPPPAAGYGPTFGSITARGAYAAAIAAEVAGTAVARVVCAGMTRGSIDTDLTTVGKVTTVAPPLSVTNDDRVVLQNYLKNGDITGVSVAPPAANDAIAQRCVDLNNDGIINEIDLNILEKSLKGYLNYIAPSFE